jgi:hypothetical protein
MPGKMTTPIRVIENHLKASADAKIKVLVNTLCYVGEQCIIEARIAGNYQDQTGNLRSSIGYAVIRDGMVVQQGYIDKTKTGNEGASEGKVFLESKIEKAKKKGLVLIVTAGMNYAEYVEARGYNVLTSAELKANSLVKSMMTKLGFKTK